LVVAVTNDLPELAAKYGGITIRAAGRTYGGSEMPPLLSEGVGLVASVGPNAYEHLRNGEGPSTAAFQTDLVVDVIGWGATWLTGKGGTAAGGLAGGMLAGGGALPGAVTGYVAGTLIASVVYDVWVGPIFVKPWAYTVVQSFH